MSENSGPAPLILASASPRRRALIGRLGVPYIVAPSDVDETTAPGLAPEAVAESLALLKARAVAAQYPGRVVIGADTVVIPYDDQPTILGKPRDDADAVRMLRLLRDRWHRVATGIAVVRAGAEWSAVVTAGVRMGAYSDAEIAGYVASGEPHDKAGAYAIQGLGGRLVAEVRGSELAVVGLPLGRLAELLGDAGVTLPIAPTSIIDRWAI
ncbi:MAG TPA: Maf family protein [Thermomicrobiales bacterium]|jgi:septum formation protein